MTVTLWPDESTVPYKAGLVYKSLTYAASVGVRSKGKPYFAAWMTAPGTAGGAPISSLGGGETTFRLVVAIDKVPVMLADPDEPHWLFSLHEIGGAEVLAIGVTPSLSVCAKTQSRTMLLSTPGAIPADGSYHDLYLVLVGSGPQQLCMDGSTLVYDDDVTPPFDGAYSQNSLPIRCMLFNGVEGKTRCECTIRGAQIEAEDKEFVWPMNEGVGSTFHGYEAGGGLGVPIIPRTVPDFPDANFDMTPDWFDPSPYYAPAWGEVPVGGSNGAWQWLVATQYRKETIVRPQYRRVVVPITDFSDVPPGGQA